MQQLGNKGNKENTNKDGGLKFIENYDILLAQEKKQSEMEKRDQLQQQQQNAMDSSDFENFKNLTNTPDKSQSSMSEVKQKEIYEFMGFPFSIFDEMKSSLGDRLFAFELAGIAITSIFTEFRFLSCEIFMLKF